MRTTAIAAFMALVTGFGVAWNWQAQRWDADVAEIRKEHSDSLLTAYQDREARIAEAESKKEEIQNEYDAFRRAEDARNASVDRGEQRVYVRAKCPAVPGATGNSGRTEAGTAELDSAARSTLSALRIRAEEQRRLLNVCRATLGIK